MPDRIFVDITRVHISSPKGCQRAGVKCGNVAYWFVGTRSLCEGHLKEFCELAGIDFQGVLDEIREKEGLDVYKNAGEKEEKDSD